MSKSRKWIVPVLAVAAVGALVVAQALAGTTTYSGAGTDDPVMKVSFDKVKSKGHPTKVKNWSVKSLHYDCVGTDDFRSFTNLHGTISKVQNGRFSYNQSHLSDSGGIRYTNQISGKFVSKTKATGTYKERRELVSDPSTYCVSKREPWSAHK